MADASDVFGDLPQGYAAVPVFPGQDQAALRVCALFRTDAADPATGRLILLHDRWDARVYLGALTDAASRVHRWLELWVQTVEATPVSMSARGQSFTNRSLDEQWAREADALDAASTRGLIRTGYEMRHPAPVLIDDATATLVPPAIGGEPLALCADDAALTAAGLPAFSTSLARYLYLPSQPADATPFIPVTPGAPTNPRTLPLADVTGKAGRSPFNPGAGLLIVREYASLRLEQFIALIEAGEPGLGETFTEAAGVPELARPGNGAAAAVATNAGGDGDGRLLLARQGRAGQWVETFYLKLCAWAGALESVYRATARTQRPLLNLSAESFRVALGRPRHGLPSLWNSDVSLCDPGDALPLKIDNAERVYFVREWGARGEAAPVYRPTVASAVNTGTGSLRIRQVLSESRGVVVESTFTPRDRLTASRNDLLRVRVGLAAGRVDLYAQLQPEQAMAGGEWRIRTIPQQLTPELAQQLKAAEGVPMGTIEYEHLPLLSTPADAYALAVLLLRTLVVGGPNASLATAVDEAWSLAREVAAGYDASVPLATRINDVFSRDERWSQRLGPKFAAGMAAAVPDGAPSPLPRALWYDTLALIVSLLPGAGPDSLYTDYGDAPPSAPHRALEPVLAAIGELLARVRSVLVVDWRLNEELGGVVRSLLRGFSAPAKPAPAPPQPAPAAPARTARPLAAQQFAAQHVAAGGAGAGKSAPPPAPARRPPQ